MVDGSSHGPELSSAAIRVVKPLVRRSLVSEMLRPYRASKWSERAMKS